jgi:phosphopantothenoylcysteine decarboxylase / phosphopantothenate---cysteine ligase
VALASALTQARAVVDVILTREAGELVRPLSFQAITHRPAHTDLFSLLAETEIGHVTLGHEADVVVVAPATAHTLARLALGLGDDLLATTVLATRAPLVLAPAMETNMLLHPATQGHLATLRQRGALIVEPGEGHLASGRVGRGRLAEPEAIVDAVRAVLARRGDLAGWRGIVTAGGTQEPIDPVRVISNRSSGRMGYALAAAAARRGAQVTLVSGPTALVPPTAAVFVPVQTAEEMREAVLQHAAPASIVIKAAAVADYRVRRPADQKIKGKRELTLELTPNPDILAEVAARATGGFIVGFAAETHDVVANARAKLEAKGIDLLVANDVSRRDIGFDAEDNEVLLIDRWGGNRPLPRMPKTAVADAVLDEILALRAAHPAPKAVR